MSDDTNTPERHLAKPCDMDGKYLVDLTLQLYARACNPACSEELHNRAFELVAEVHRRIENSETPIWVRCMAHREVPQQNKNEITGAECGGCIAAERDEARRERDDVTDRLGATLDANSRLLSKNSELQHAAECRDALRAELEKEKAESERLRLALGACRDALIGCYDVANATDGKFLAACNVVMTVARQGAARADAALKGEA